MHHARTVVGGDVIGQHNEVGLARERVQLERALVGPALHLGAADLLLDAPALPQDLLEQRFGDDEPLLAVAGEHVGDARVDRGGGVGDQRPRRRRPDQQAGFAGPGAAGQREAHVDRRVDDVLVALGELVIRKRSAATRAVGRHPVVLDEQAGLVDLLQRPPHRLHVIGGHRPVGVVEIDPVAHPLGHLGERMHVALHRLATAGIERLDAERLDIGLAVEAELLLHRELDGQAVTIPARLTIDAVALHGTKAREDVFEDASLDVVGTRHAVGGRRAFVEGPARAVLGALPGFGEGIALSP